MQGTLFRGNTDGPPKKAGFKVVKDPPPDPGTRLVLAIDQPVAEWFKRAIQQATAKHTPTYTNLKRKAEMGTNG